MAVSSNDQNNNDIKYRYKIPNYMAPKPVTKTYVSEIPREPIVESPLTYAYVPNNRAVAPASYHNKNVLSASTNNQNMYMPNDNHMDPPVGVPMFPLHGYDNCEDFDKDLEYISKLYPQSIVFILQVVESECNKLEYDGSLMFDQYPDKVSLKKITDRIYNKCKDNMQEEKVIANELLEIQDHGKSSSNYLKDIVEVLLLHEMLNRRRRYRSKRRWY